MADRIWCVSFTNLHAKAGLHLQHAHPKFWRKKTFTLCCAKSERRFHKTYCCLVGPLLQIDTVVQCTEDDVYKSSRLHVPIFLHFH